MERSTKTSFGFGRVEVDLERSGVDFVWFDDSEPSNESFDRVIVDFERPAFTKSGETEAGLVRAVVIVIEDEVVIALKEEDALKDVATEYKLPEVLAVERIDEEGSRPPFVSPAASAGNAPKLGGGGSSSKGGGLLKVNACL